MLIHTAIIPSGDIFQQDYLHSSYRLMPHVSYMFPCTKTLKIEKRTYYSFNLKSD